ncbi:MAG: PepSY domain-containing protein [Planctomycetes bacterium]|nr:PepSY domain-containing protein [Planctomycetota bacterium]
MMSCQTKEAMMRNGMIALAAFSVFLAGTVLVADGDDAAACAAAVKTAKVTPMQAVEIALKAVGEGAVAYEMEVEIEGGIAVYEVHICKLGRRHTVDVGCENGKIVKQSDHADLRFGLYKWNRMKTTIAQAMEIALEKVPGQVIDVDLTDAMGTPKFEVDIYSEGKVKEVKVNSSTGQVTKIEDD